MPEMDGLEVCRRLKAKPDTRDIPLMFLSASVELTERVAGLQLGAVDFVTKPFQREELLARVRTHLELGRLRARLEEQVTERTAKLEELLGEQKRVESELRASEERLELAHAVAGIGAWDWNISTDVTRCCGSYGSLYGLPRIQQAPPSEQWLNLIHPDDRERVREELRQALVGSLRYDTEFRVLLPDGSVRWLMGKGQVYRDAQGTAVRMLGVNLDITDRKTTADQLRALSASLITAQEEERGRISRELHDDLVQRLALMAMDLGKLVSQAKPVPPSLRKELRGLQERVVQAAELTRHIAHELHPLILEDLGIVTALRSLCEEFARREEVEVKFISDDLSQSLTRETVSCLYAVAKESLMNIAKHACAKRVQVRLEGTHGLITLTISDDGIGFAAGRDQVGHGLGILNMRERVGWANGRFSLESQAGHGTLLCVEIPVTGESRENYTNTAC
jgi:signal transduction histidine kinase